MTDLPEPFSSTPAPSDAGPKIRQRTRPPALPDQGASPKPPYDVGYRKPPTASQFKKGQSGNPKGRPKFAKSMNTIMREQMQAPTIVYTAKGKKKVCRAEGLIMKANEQAGKGDYRFMSMMLDRYAAAVPDEAPVDETAADTASFTDTDKAILADYEKSVLARAGRARNEDEDHDGEKDR